MRKIREITVATPFLDSKAKVLYELFQRFKPQKIKLVVQNNQSVGDIKSIENLQQEGMPLQVYLFQDENHYLHAKIYIFKTQQGSFALTGSANCTESAWLHKSRQGNFETMLLVKAEGNNHFDYLFKDKVSTKAIVSLSSIQFRERKSIEPRKGYPIGLHSVSLSDKTLSIVFDLSEDGTHTLVLNIAATPMIQLPLGEFTLGNHQVFLNLSEHHVDQIQDKPLISYICFSKGGMEYSDCVSNEIWITNIGELTRIRRSLNDVGIRSGEYLSLGCLSSEEEWRDLFHSISQIIRLEVERAQKNPIRTFTIRGGEKSEGIKEENQMEKETEVTFPGDYEIEKHEGVIEATIFRESTFFTWLEYVMHTLPWKENDVGNTQKTNIAPQRVRKQPSQNITGKFTSLISRYIRALINARYMQSVSIHCAINYYTIFQRMVWLLYKHQAINQVRFVEYSKQINNGFFYTSISGAPVLSPNSQKHVRRNFRKEWFEYGVALHALVTCIVINKLWCPENSETGNCTNELNPLILANIAVVADFEELLNGLDQIIEFSRLYELDSVILLCELDQLIIQWLTPASHIIGKWIQNITLSLDHVEDEQLMRWLLQARVDYGLALEQIYIRLEDKEGLINLTSDLIFWAERSNDVEVVQIQRERLMIYLRDRGDLRRLARQLLESGKDYRNRGLYNEATRHFNQALLIAEQTNEPTLIRLLKTYLSAMKFYTK